ncbi:hypothetical protein ACFQZS_04475 [Mucilaginibacter calamicampi]|uniref:Viral A-type inclusion protein n=1 Tax=Mucilaginibacter calamicampi TaxID=1302352 RepID=A0ABW2YSI8_9SPHI
MAILKLTRLMKKLFIPFALIVLAFASCTDEKAQKEAEEKTKEKTYLNEVIKIHDEVMGKEDRLMRNKMKIDTILIPDTLNAKYTVVEKATLSALRSKLLAADEAMSKWMQDFDAELKGKTHEEKIKYYIEQKKAVTQIDSIFTAVIEGSDKYLKEIKK